MPLPPHQHGPEWIVASHDEELPRPTFAAMLSNLGDILNHSGSVALKDKVMEVPALVTCDLRYERTPHGGYALMIRAEWSPDSEPTLGSIAAASLDIRPA
jgi:hypothetical protein